MSELCRVCGDPKARKHYGSVCCSGCKGFFRRTVIFKQIYRCKFNKSCKLTSEYRNFCRACRFDKCLAVGLDLKDVHETRDEANKAMVEKRRKTLELTFNLENAEYLNISNLNLQFLKKSETNNPTLKPLGALNLVKEPDKTDLSTVVQYFVDVEKLCNDYCDLEPANSASSSRKISFTTNITAIKALTEPRLICERTKMEWSDRFFITSSCFPKIWCRIFLHYIDWTSHIPELNEFSVDEKFRLVMDRGTSCVLLFLGYKAVQNNIKGLPFSNGAYFPAEPNDQSHVDPIIRPLLINFCDWIYSEFIEPSKQMNLSFQEYAILKLLVFFTPVPGLSAEGKKRTQTTYKFYRQVLLYHILKDYSFLPAEAIQRRIGKVMNFLYVIEMAMSLCDKGFSTMNLFNIANMRGELPFEVHIRKGLKN